MNDIEREKQITAILRRPYRHVIYGEPEEGYLAKAPELPGCFTAGETPEEAMAMLRDAMAAWIESALLDGAPIPEPAPEPGASGRMLLRLPRSLHQRLTERAEVEGVSINQLATVLIAYGLGERTALSGSMNQQHTADAFVPAKSPSGSVQPAH